MHADRAMLNKCWAIAPFAPYIPRNKFTESSPYHIYDARKMESSELANMVPSELASATPVLVYDTLSIDGLSPQRDLQDYQRDMLNLICSCASYMDHHSHIPFKDSATVLFVLAFGYKSQPRKCYVAKNWKKPFWSALQSGRGLPARIVEHFETNHLRVVRTDPTNITVITTGERPSHVELEGHGEGLILEYLPHVKQEWERAGLWQKFEVKILQEFEVEIPEEFECQIHRDGPGFMKKTLFVVAIIVGVFYILHRRRGVGMR